MLDQQDPSDVLAGPKLPHLVYADGRDDMHYGTIFAADVFFLTESERTTLRARVAERPRYAGRQRDLRLLSTSRSLDLTNNEFDLVVGNPPWEEAGEKSANAATWATVFGLAVGDGSLSQLFIHRSLAFTRPGGIVALLVGAKVLWNDRATSCAFRRHMLMRTTVRQVVNMAHVRREFFVGAVAPFVLMVLENCQPRPSDRVVFWNARRTRARDRHQSVMVTQLDRRVVTQRDLLETDYLWKTYWWGSHRDAALISRLAAERTLGDVVRGVVPEPAYGWQRGTVRPTGVLARLPELSVRAVRQFGPLLQQWFLPPPTGVKRDPDHRLYVGPRLIITHGIKDGTGPIARTRACRIHL